MDPKGQFCVCRLLRVFFRGRGAIGADLGGGEVWGGGQVAVLLLSQLDKTQIIPQCILTCTNRAAK